MVKIEKIADLDYNELVALNVIEKDKDLYNMFTEDVKLPFSMLYRMSKENLLNEDIKKIIFDFFDDVISTKKSYIEKYLRVFNSDLENLVPQKIDTQEIPKEEVIVKELPVKKVTTKKLPKWYGKEKIMIDIKNQGGVPTIPQLAALANNDLKNIYLAMNSKCINDMLTDNRKVSDEEYRTYKSAVRTLQNMLKPILKTKKK